VKLMNLVPLGTLVSLKAGFLTVFGDPEVQSGISPQSNAMPNSADNATVGKKQITDAAMSCDILFIFSSESETRCHRRTYQQASGKPTIRSRPSQKPAGLETSCANG
jgi:hypothetical protein